VRLTVVDDVGGTGSVEHTVSVSSPAGVTFASDAFGRTVANGWGSADVGGAWTVLQSPTAYSVGQGQGLVRLGAGTTARISLGATSTDTDLTLDFATSAVPVGGAINERFLVRRVSNGNDYDVRVNLNANGKVGLSIVKFVGGTETALTSAATVPGVTLTAGGRLSLHAQALGANPTTLRARLWPTGNTEPTTWNATATDTTAALAGAGGFGINSFLSSAATNAPITLSFDDLLASTPGSGPPPNQPPTASFTASCSALSCTFDGSGSHDPDGTITGYAWDFGDGGTADTAMASHTFPAAGSYTVELVVTDDDAAQGELDQGVTVSASVVPFAADSFARTVSSGWGSADVGGKWTLSGGATNFAVASGAGTMRLAANGFDAAYLPASSSGADLSVQLACSAVPVGGSLSALVIARRVSAGNQYAARIYVNPNRSVTVQLLRQVGGAETTLGPVTTVPGLSATAGVPMAVRLQSVGTSPTTVRARVWLASGSEPTTWLTTATDATASLQAAGSIGITSFLAAKATNGPITFSVSSLQAVPA
jgi:PKD repeat protein